MTRLRKYLIIILSMLAAMLCAAGVSTWIISTPKIITPLWEAAQPQQQKVYVKKIVETTPAETVTGSYLSNAANKKLEFSFEGGADASSAIQSFGVGTANSGGAVPNVEFTKGEEIKVGCTYSVSVLDITFVSTSYSLAGTYKNRKEGGLDGIEESSSINIILKHKTVDVGGTLYTIEDALATGGNATVKADTSFAGKDVANQVGYTSSNYTVSSGETLLLPYDGNDGLNTTTSADTSAFGTNAKKVELKIGEGITLTNNGTLNIGGITTGRQGGQSGCTAGDHAQITLGKNAIINSYGNINAYGFIAEADDNNGSEVIVNTGTLLMPFIVVEHRGGTAFANMVSKGAFQYDSKNLKTSPFNRFYMENVHPQLTVLSGAILKGHANLFANDHDNTTDINLVGTSGYLINLSQNTKLVAKYNVNAKIMSVEIKGSATLNALELSLTNPVSITLSTKTVHFPISWHFNITLSSYEDGNPSTVTATEQKLKLLPSAKFTVGKNVTLIADELVVYDEKAIDFVDPTKSYDPSTDNVKKNIPATLIINGTLQANKLAGHVQTEIDNAHLVISNGNTIATKEITAIGGTTGLGLGDQSKYKDISHTLNGAVYNDGNISQQNLNVGTYISKLFEDIGVWLTKEIPSVTYQAGEGSFANGEKSVTKQYSDLEDLQGETKILGQDKIDSETPTRPYYEFLGWATKQSGATAADVIKDGLEITIGNEITLYAVWKPIEYTFNYDILDGSTGEHKTGLLATWTAEMGQLTLSGVELPVDKPVGYEFDGWYSNPECTLTVDNIDVSNAGSVFKGETSVTVYGKLEQEFTATIVYDLGDMSEVQGYSELQNVLPVNTTIDSGLSIKEKITTWADGCPVDININLAKYFAGWKIRTANGDEEITEGTTVSGGLCTSDNGNWTLTLVAQWADKTKVIFKDDTVGFTSQDYYYKPGQTVEIDSSDNLTIVAPDGQSIDIAAEGSDKAATSTTLHSKDCDISEKTYYNDGGWSGAGEVGETAMTITVQRANKVTLSVTVKEKAQITLRADNVQGLPDKLQPNKNWVGQPQDTTKVYYLKPGTVVDYTFVSNADPGNDNNPECTYSVSGDLKEGGFEYQGAKDEKSGSFTLKESEGGEVKISATTKDGTCIVEGTLITMADGTQKPVEDLTKDDIVLTFNHTTGQYEPRGLNFIAHQDDAASLHRIVNLVFSDGTTLRIVASHSLFDLTLRKYVSIEEGNMTEFIGHSFNKVDVQAGQFENRAVTLVSAYITEECVRVFSPTSEMNINIVAEGLLTLSRIPYGAEELLNMFDFDENMKYDEEKMKADIKTYGVYTYDDFKDYMTYEEFINSPVPYLKVGVGKGLVTFEQIIKLLEYQKKYTE